MAAEIIKQFTAGYGAGELTLRRRGNRIELDDFYVVAGRRGRGLGRMLLGRAVGFMRRYQLTVYLIVAPFDSSAMSVEQLMAVYERYGFKKTKPHIADSREMVWTPEKVT